MTRSCHAMWALALLALAAPVRAQSQSRLEYGYPPPLLEPAPPSGIGALAVGISGLGLAGVNLVTIPVCYAEFYSGGDEDLSRGCMIASFVLAGVAASVGIPSLVVGLRRRERYKAWRARQRMLGELSPWGARSAVGAQYTLRF